MISNGNGRMPQHQEFRHGSSGSLNIPVGTNGISSHGGGIGGGRYDQAKAPTTKQQNTSHVPCKFYRQGTCQAGNSCPFSHTLDSGNDNVCKYFAKGNCKFGPKCANAHILPNGVRVCYNSKGARMDIGNRILPNAYQRHGSGLANAFGGGPVSQSPYTPTGIPQYSHFGNSPDEYSMNAMATIDTTFPPQDTSYGSPRDDDRYAYGLSPGTQRGGLSVMDAPLPASFDSEGLSAYAHHAVGKGALATSAPTKFGLDSLLGHVGVSSDALKSLQASAFAEDNREQLSGIGSSPPNYPTEEYYGRRAMHSQRSARPRLMSSSLPQANQDWDVDFFEEDYVPLVLDDLLTQEEKARRGSRNATDEGRPNLQSGAGTPIGTPIKEIGTKFGSPSNASPSRWAPRPRNQAEDEKYTSRASAFGHVGSPLRNSTLHLGASPSARPTIKPSLSGDSSPYTSSPPRTGGISAISLALGRTRISRADSNGSESSLHPNRAISNSVGSGPRTVAERQISSGSIGSSGRFTTPIDEEPLFKMDGMDDDSEKKPEKRNSGGSWLYPVNKNNTNGNSVQSPGR
ncbi:spindle poison sensitivity protein-like protein Scp3 [Calycina marina]|uniref:Spindle poison sensitivity protein-like protein Scp3 n=1 Tax=Calycina marina TaxID=1763456 RepID=A0A9P7Z3W4_9HELO|nr:spindle poison sensitivity protein-like protein Scp3 [Calycina marina]